MKLMLFRLYNLTSYEMDNLLRKWDDNQNGFIDTIGL